MGPEVPSGGGVELVVGSVVESDGEEVVLPGVVVVVSCVVVFVGVRGTRKVCDGASCPRRVAM